ncbi:MAG: RagB/SusD family nutrient uptake outer membrane protein, partial [Bacteroidota bacterium]|nr:RagB/SusD family nutrient uptake outer membrane protein [Bacteroidota bacterium]
MKKYFYLFSKKYLLLAIIPLLMISSCSEEVLKETPLDFLAPENAYTTVAGINQGINGLHLTVRERYVPGNFLLSSIWRGLGTDLAYFGEDPNSTRYLCNYVNYLKPQAIEVETDWIFCYKIIQRANVLIDKISTSDASIWSSEAQKNVPLAEAMFFRAFAYRTLVSYFGDVPLVAEVIKTVKTDFVRAPKADIYKLMEEDLTFAAANLPEPGKEEAPGRITQGAAWHMLSELYLTETKYQLAVEAASKVIDGYHYALMTTRFGTKLGHDVFGSGDVYLDLFGYGNQNLAENTEAIWVIQNEPFILGGGSGFLEGYFGPSYFRMGNTPDGKKAFIGEFVNGAYTGYSDTLGRPTATMRPTNYAAYNIWHSDWKNDIRNAKHNIKRDFYYNNPASIYDKQKIDFSLYALGTRDAMRDTNQYIFPYFLKFADPLNHFTDPARSGGGRNHKDVYAIRLAETLLLRAEAYLGLNNKTAAAADINKIRNRANATPVIPD